MNFVANINVMPQKEILDPQGKAVTGGLKNLGLNGVQDVRVGKHITLQITANSTTEANEIADTACKKLLANLIMETYEFTIAEVK